MSTALLADADSSIKSGDWDQALEQLENVKNGDPSQPEVYEKLVHVLSVRGKFRSVIATYLELLKVLVESDQLDRADSVVGEILALQPELSEARERRIEIEKKRGNTARAVQLSRELARLCIEQGDGDLSIRLLQDAQQDEPENLDISLELAEMYVSYGHIQDGANQYRKVANAFLEAGNVAKAAEAYRRMKVVQSDDPTVLLTLGRLYTELGKLDEAEQEFRSVLRHDLDHEEALLELGLVCQLKGRFRSGILAFNKVLQNNPDLVHAKRKLGELHHSQGMTDESVEFFLQAAQGYLEAEERDQAIELFQIVLGIDENNGPAQQGLTNLEAPLTPKEFVPPQPPTPPEAVPDPPPAPSPAPVEAAASPEPAGGGVAEESAEIAAEATVFEPADVAEDEPPPQPTAEPQAPAAAPPPPSSKPSSSAGAANKRRASGLSLKRGLVAPDSTGGKPMLGAKPTLGGPRPGMRRPGLGAKTLGGEKPTLGGRKPTLPRRGLAGRQMEGDKPFLEQSGQGAVSQEAPPPPDFAPAPDFGDSMGGDFPDMEPMGDAAPALEDVFANPEPAQGGGFGDDFDLPDSPFSDEPPADGPRLSLGGDDEADFGSIDTEAAAAAGPVLGAFSGAQAEEDSPVEAGGLKPGYAPSTGGDLFDDDGGDIFSDDGGDIFSDDGGVDFFADESGSGGDLFDEASAGQDAGGSLFDEMPVEEPQAQGGGGLFEDDQSGDPFGDLFDEPGAAPVAVADAPPSGGDLFDEPGATGEAPGEDFNSLFDDEPAPSPAAETVAAQPGDFFAEEGGGDDLFGSSDDLFSAPAEHAAEPAPIPDGDDLFSTVGEAESVSSGDSIGEDLFSTMDESEPAAGQSLGIGEDLFDSPPASDAKSEVETGSLFESTGGDDFGGSLFDDPSSEEALASPAVEVSGDDLFETMDSAPSMDLFDEPAAADPSADLFDEPATPGGDDLFASPAAEQDDDLFGGALSLESAEVEVASEGGGELFEELDAGGDTLFDGFDAPGEESGGSSPTETAFDSAADDLFAEPVAEVATEPEDSAPEDDLFAIPEPSSTVMTEAEEEMFTLEPLDSPSLFDEPAPAEAPVSSMNADDLDLSIPDPLAPSSPDAEVGEGDIFSSGESPEPVDDLSLDQFDFGESEMASTSEPEESAPAVPDDAGPSMEQMRAEEAARSLPVNEEDAAAESPEFMKLLEMTLPPTEAPVAEVEPEAEPEIEPETSISDAMFSDDFSSMETDSDPSAEEMTPEPELVVPEPEPEPVPEEPAVLGKPVVSLSIEDESSDSDIAEADQVAASLGQTDVASRIAAYRKAIEGSPDNLVLRTRLADIHLKYGLLEDAVVQYRQIIRRNPDSISLLHRVIQAEFWNENFVEAGQSLLALGQLHLKRGEKHDAIDALQSVLSLDPLHFEARKVLVSVFADLGESKLAAHHLRQLAETALTKGEVSEAINAFEQLLELSDDPVFEERLAQIYEGQGDIEKALAKSKSLVGRYREEERWEEAARVTERIVELDPGLLEDRGSLIELYEKLGEKERAVAQQFQLARLYQESGNLPLSIELYEKVLAFQADNQEARRNLVDAYLDSGTVESALHEADALTEHYLETKDFQTAIELYQKLVQADGENVDLQEKLVKFYSLAGDPESANRRWVEISDLHEKHSRFDKAAESIRKSLEIDGSQLDLIHRLARLYTEQLGDKLSSLEQLRNLFAQAPERLDAVKMYIDLLLDQEQVAEAGQVLQQLEEAGGESAAIKNSVISSLRDNVESSPGDLKAKFNYGELCYHLGDLDHAIEQFQQTRRSADFELISYNMLGLCFAKKRGFNMLDLAIKQFKKGLETRGHAEQDYLELRYNLALLQYQNKRPAEALNEFRECYTVDIAYKDVRDWIQKIENEMVG